MKSMLAVLIAFSAVVFAPSAAAQSYPAKTVRIIVPFPAGGNTDITARTIGSRLADVFGQQVIIDNRPGGGATIGAALAARAVPDGYTLFMAAGAHTINMSLLANLPYDTVRDFAPIILCIKGASVLTVHPSLPAKNLKELIALAKAKPGQLNFASSGLGSTNHMGGELLKMMAGINILHVPYKGNSPALTDNLAGHVEMMFSGVPVLLPHIKSGRLRAIAIGSLTRFPALPNVPTFDESGLKGYEVVTFAGLMAPVKTPTEIIGRLNVEVNRILKSPDMQTRFMNDGSEPIGGSQEEFAKFIREEIAKYAKLIKVVGIKPQ